MSDLPFDKDAANSVSTRLTAAKAGLGHSYEGRWVWWRKRRRAEKISRVFQDTTPVFVTHYMTATRSVSDVSAQVRRTRRLYFSWLWLRIVASSIWAAIRRARVVLLALLVIVASSIWAAIRRARVVLLALLVIVVLARVTYIYGPLALNYLSELSAQEPVADQTTPTLQITTPSQTPSANPQSQGSR